MMWGACCISYRFTCDRQLTHALLHPARGECMCRSIKVAEPDVVSYGGLTTVTTYHLQRKDEHVVDSGEWPLTECLGEGACWEGACWESTETHCPTLHVTRINSICAPPTPP